MTTARVGGATTAATVKRERKPSPHTLVSTELVRATRPGVEQKTKAPNAHLVRVGVRVRVGAGVRVRVRVGVRVGVGVGGLGLGLGFGYLQP